jgi:predicted chitinase
MTNLLSRLFNPEPQPAPILPTPDTFEPRLVVPVEPVADPLPPIKNWSHPFRDRRDPLQQLTPLANAISGCYPLGGNGLWHGGVHFDGGTAATFDQSSVHCIADGEVVAYRIDQHAPTTRYFVNTLPVDLPFSRNFVLVRHRLQPPQIDGNPDAPPSLTFYSLYMHLQDWAVYEADSTLARPGFWREGSTRYVRDDVKDLHGAYPGQHGLNVRSSARHGKVLGLLPRGAEVVISGEGDYRKLENTPGPERLQVANGSLRGFVAARFLTPIAGGQHRVECTSTLNVRSHASMQGNRIFELPDGTEVTVSGEGEYRRLERVNQYVHDGSLRRAPQPQARDAVVVLDTPVPIKAGELIGHLGLHQDIGTDRPDHKLHLEVFSGDTLKAFIEQCRLWADKLPASSKTSLKLVKGTPVVSHQASFTTKQPPSLKAASVPSDAGLLVPKRVLDNLSADRKITVAASRGHNACNWYRLQGLLHDAEHTVLDGWVCEEVGVTPWVSPWSWDGHDILFNGYTPRHLLASFMRATGQMRDDLLEKHNAIADSADQGPIKTRLYDIIDRNRDGQITAAEINNALCLPAHAQSISQLIIHTESEWHHTDHKWDQLDELLGHSGSTPHLNWLAEKQRIKEHCWWGEVAGKLGLPGDGKVYHLHPVGLLGRFMPVNPLEITAAQLKQIFPRAEDGDIDTVLNEINGRLDEFKLDTRLRQRHFFAQIKGEVGAGMKGVTESWEYSPAALKAFSVYYRAHPEEAEEDGYLKNAEGKIIRRANQQAIGRKHFQRLNGNRGTHPDDGFNLRGRGLIQITGYDNYAGYVRDFNVYWKGAAPNAVVEPELINKMPNAIRSALWFWLQKQPYRRDKGNGLADVSEVTYSVNGGYTGLSERQKSYEEIEAVLK